MKRFYALLLGLSLLLSAVPLSSAADSTARQETILALGIMAGDETGALHLERNVTRAEFVTMMTAASPYKDTVGSGFGVSLFSDVKSSHWASEYIRLAVEQGWVAGYMDGSFRPDRNVTLEEGCTCLLRLLGYGSGDLAGSYPTAQLSKAQSVGLLDQVTAGRGQTLDRADCLTLFYNLLTAKTKNEGMVYGASLGYSVKNGEVDYSSLVNAGMKGPFIVQSNGVLDLPFSSAAVYRNGVRSSLSAVQQYDVYYYNGNLRSAWVYSDRATGTLTAVSPNRSAPESVTVAGINYPIETSQAAYQLSSQGDFPVGSTVTLLLGKDGSVAAAVSPLNREAEYYGVVVSSSRVSSTSSTSTGTASAQSETRVACSDGVVRTFYHNGLSSAGQLVTVTVSDESVRLSSMQTKHLSGKVDAAGTGVAGYTFAANIEILDTDGEGGYIRLYPSRLAGLSLADSCVRYFTCNASGEIDRLILDEATGDTLEYIYITRAESINSGMNLSGSYNYLSSGESKSISGGTIYPVSSGGAAILRRDGQIKSLRQLNSVTLDTLNDLTAKSSGKTLQLWDSVQVLLKDPAGGYRPTSLSDINSSDYSLTGWVDSLNYPAGGVVRIIVAVKN